MSANAHSGDKDTDEPNGPPTASDVYRLLKADRRRAVISILEDESPLPKRELTTRVAELLGHDRKNVYVGLQQDHLPPLLESGMILETNRGYILGPNADRMLSHMKLDSGDDDGGGLTDKVRDLF